MHGLHFRPVEEKHLLHIHRRCVNIFVTGLAYFPYFQVNDNMKKQYIVGRKRFTAVA